MRKIKNPWLYREGYNCFGCCPDNPLGLHMVFFEDGDDIVSYWKPGDRYQGWLNVLHGGIIASLIDETAGWVVFRKLQTSGVTSSLNVRYKKAVSTLEPELTIRGRITEQRRNLVTITVELSNANGELCVTGEVVYFIVSSDKAKELGFTECELEGEELLSF
ncbi:MAG: PaaI family thioesterase [Prevotella sp.]|nr:PaaI family thioesterase [Prevotella sp.]MBR6945164.1 PaaI family thioesterase [Prevotella sp.]